jgi:hypothetical protein
MKKLSLVTASLLVLGTASAFAQTPSGDPSGSTQGSGKQPACSASDAARIRNGQQPSTPCTVSPSGSGGSSSMPGGGGASGGSPTPAPGQ